MSRQVRKYVKALLVTIQSGLAYPLDPIVRAAFTAVVIFVFIQLWTVTFEVADVSTVAGFDRTRMVWYLVLTETIVMSCPRLSSRIDGEVKGGDVAYQLGRPYHYAWFHYALYLGEALLLLPVNFAVAALLALLFVGVPEVSLLAGMVILLAIMLAISLNFVIELIIGLLAFWFEDTFAFFWIYQKVVFTLGGMLLPLDLFPPILRSVAANLPFTSIAYGPSRLVTGLDAPRAAWTIGAQLFWIVAFAALASWLYRRGVQRLSLNGG